MRLQLSEDPIRRPPDPNIELLAVYPRVPGAGRGLQDLFGWGRLAVGFSGVVGPAEFVVRQEDEQRASDLPGNL